MRILAGVVIYLALGLVVTSGFVWYCDDWSTTDDYDVGIFAVLWAVWAVMILLTLLLCGFATVFGRLVRRFAGYLPKKLG